MEIRHIQKNDDRAEISRIYEESWKSAYKDIIPQSYLQSIPAGHWASHLDSQGMNSLVMIEDGTFIGTSSYCQSRFLKFKGFGEIVSIYLLPSYVGKGYGTQLLDAVLGQMKGLRYKDVFLWVLEENHRARAFYENRGFKASGDYLDDNIGGKALREIQYRCRIG